MGSQASQSRELRWRRLYEAAVLEMDQEILPRRVTVAKKAIHSQIVRSHKMDEAGELWALMDAINVLNDLLKMNEADLRQRAKKGHTRKGWRALVDIPMPLRTRLAV